MAEPGTWTRMLCAALEQGVELATSLEPATFARPIPPGQSGVGSHLRHVADFVRAFLDGARSGRIDYDARRRDELLEREPARAARHLRGLIRELEALEPLDGDALARVVLVRTEAPADAAPEDGWHGSTLGRELAALVSHTVHHHALVALALRQLGAAPPPELGVAPSTLAHWQACSTRGAAPAREPLALQRA